MNTKVSLLRRIAVSVLGIVFAAALALALTFTGSTAYAASDRYDVTATVRNISPGVNETEYYTNTTENNDQVVARAITVDLSQNTLIAGYKDYDTSGSWGMQSVREQAAAAESARGVNVVAAVNGDFYNMGTGQPMGVLVMGGKVVNGAAGRNYFAILKDGTAVIRSGSLQGDEAEALGGDLTYTSLKGYDHYPCLRRLDRAAEEPLPLAEVPHDGRSDNAVGCDMLTAIAVTYAFACQAPEGDLDALGIRWRYVPRSMLTVTSGECLRGRCPYFPGTCLLHGARRRANCSDVVVTNHSLLLCDVEAEGRILPPVRDWVVDEAHAFEAEARRQWAVEVSGADARTAFERIGGTQTGALHAAMVDAMALEGSTLMVGLLTKAAAAASRAQVAVAGLFSAVHELGSLARGDGGYDTVTLWLDATARASAEWAEVRDAAAGAEDALDETVRALADASSAMEAQAPQQAADLADHARELRDLLAGIRLICEGTDESYVYSAQLARSRKRMASERLVAEKLDVGAEVASRWLPEMESVVFTSATIAVGDDFSHFDRAVGLADLPEGSHRDVRLDSSFDYDAHMSVVVAGDLPAPNERGYLEALEELLFDVHVAMGGSVLTLFTNRRDMERVYESLRPRLAAQGLEVACQERGSSPRRLRTRFMAEKTLSLMALRSFWEGFDATGDTLRCVVIPKLPFASPTDPLVREREAREDRAWWRYSLPEAVLSVKQAAGRLIRSATDTGVLVLADSRVATKRYGSLFVKSLPSRSVSRLEAANVGRYLRIWRAGHE